jgi:hypothetical protein
MAEIMLQQTQVKTVTAYWDAHAAGRARLRPRRDRTSP